MGRGRPPKGIKLLDPLDASEHAKERLRVLLLTIKGELSTAEACQQLNICEARFHALRKEWLQSSLSSLEPKAPGPKPAVPTPEQQQLAQLQEKYKELSLHYEAAQLRTQIALTMPHLLVPQYGDNSKKKTPKK